MAGIAAAAAAAAAGRPLAAKPHPSHNPDCGCVVCANSRRNSRIHAGGQGPGLLAPRSSSDPGSQPEAAAPPNRVTAPASGAATAAAAAAGSGMEQGIPAIRACMALAEQQPAYNLRGYAAPSSGGAPRFRDGKRSFLRALPQLATAGPTPHQVRPAAFLNTQPGSLLMWLCIPSRLPPLPPYQASMLCCLLPP